MTIRIGLIGAGVMGADHAQTIFTCAGGAELAAIHDTDQNRARAVAERCGNPRVTEAAAQLIEDPQIDAVLISSPDPTHAPLAVACVEAGKPALVEKPIAATLDECRAVIAAEMKGKRRCIQVGFMRRFDPGYLAMKDIIREGRLGAPLFLHCQHRNAVGPDYLTSELVIANSAVHEIDIARFLLDDEFAAVTVTSPRASSRAPGRQAQFIVLETRSGVVVDVEVFVDATYGYEVKGELVCEAGTAMLTPGPAVTTREAGREQFSVEPDWRDRFRTAYRDQVTGWVKSIRSGTPSGASAWDGYIASVTAAACLEARRSRTRTSVSIDEVPDFYR